VQRAEGLTERIYSIADGKHLAAAYYRNTIIHFFVNPGITELALGVCIHRDDPLIGASIVDRAMEIRDLLKFEFFFQPSDDFAAEIESEVQRFASPNESGDDTIGFSSNQFYPMSPIVLSPFFEAYYVVAATLVAEGDAEITTSELEKRALQMGDQLAAHGDISQKEAVSTALFATGIELAMSRGLLTGSAHERHAFHQELEEILATFDEIDSWFSE